MGNLERRFFIAMSEGWEIPAHAFCCKVLQLVGR